MTADQSPAVRAKAVLAEPDYVAMAGSAGINKNWQDNMAEEYWEFARIAYAAGLRQSVVSAEAKPEVAEYSQGVCGDGAAILRDGQPMSVDEVVAALKRLHTAERERDEWKAYTEHWGENAAYNHRRAEAADARAQETALSGDARVMAGMFGMTRELTFEMRDSRPTARCKAALDELVAATVITTEPYNQFGGIVYKRCWDADHCRRLVRGIDWKKHRFTIAEPIRTAAPEQQEDKR